jgi:hypothetical protein
MASAPRQLTLTLTAEAAANGAAAPQLFQGARTLTTQAGTVRQLCKAVEAELRCGAGATAVRSPHLIWR